MACDINEVEDRCSETIFSERYEKDTMFFGTWRWYYSINTCDYQSTEIRRDTIWPNEFVPEIGTTYPNRLITISEDLRVITDLDT